METIDQAPAIDTTIAGAADAFESLLNPEDETPEEEVAPPPDEPATEEAKAEDAEESTAEEEVPDDDEEEAEPVPVFTVKVDGVEKQVDANELVKGYQLHADYTRKSQALAEARREHQAEMEAVKAEREHNARMAQALEARVRELAPPQVDWQKLRQTDPIEFAAQWAQHQMRQQELQFLQQEQARVAEAQAAEQEQRRMGMLQTEAEKLTEAIPEWKDAKKASAEKKAVREYALSLGFDPQDVDGVMDHRVIKALYDAHRYNQLVKQRPQVRERVAAAKVIEPGPAAAPRKVTDLSRSKMRLAQTGRVEDAAAIFEKMMG